MKKAKRLVSLLLAFVMLMSLAIGVGADGETIPMEGSLPGGKITITKAVDGEKYDLYQVMYLDSFEEPTGSTTDDNGNPVGGKYSYAMTNAWQGFLEYNVPLKDGETEQKKVKDVYLTVDPNNGMVTWNAAAGTTDPIYQEFAQLALTYAKENNIKPVATATASGETQVFDSLNLGYYLIDTTLGTLCTLDTTNKVINVQEKNKVPTNEKMVKEDSRPDN